MAHDSKKVWFGTRDLMQWVKAPATNMGRARRQWESATGYLNGGQSMVASNYSALTYTLAWSVLDSETESTISGYHAQVYGDGLLYFSDPFSWDNVMPLNWSSAYLAAQDAPSLIQGRRPTVAPVTVNNGRFPTRAAVYNVAYLTDQMNDLYVPVPRGYGISLGAIGTVTGTAGIELRTEIDGPNYATTVPFFPTSSQLIGGMTYRYVENANGENDFVRLYLTGEGQISLVGVQAFITKIGADRPTYDYFPMGRGNSGMRFETAPQITAYSSVLDQQAMTASLVETGAWE